LQERLGTPGDGGKWICDPQRLLDLHSSHPPPTGAPEVTQRSSLPAGQRPCLVYSFGSGDEWGFEEGIIDTFGDLCDVHTFDHTIGAAPPHRPASVHFHQWGLGEPGEGQHLTADTRGPLVASLTAIRKALQHDNRVIDIVKFDIEQAEVPCLTPLLQNAVAGRGEQWPGHPNQLIRQVLLETHLLRNTSSHTVDEMREEQEAVGALLQGFLDNGYVIFSKEGNMMFQHEQCCGTSVEYGFLKLGLSTA